MEENTKLNTATIIVSGILKLLWYLFLVAAGSLIFLVMLAYEASKPNKSSNC